MADLFNKTKNTKYHTVKTVTKTNRKNVETQAKSIPIIHMYMTTLLPGLFQSQQYKVAGLN